MHVKQEYRPDIDGLRAIAVLSVVLFHIETALVPGGFIGVDIFFVISGFLITRNIRTAVRNGTFSLKAFYAGRIRRIAPALFVVLAATLVAGRLILTPVHLRELGESTIASALSVANIYFTYFVDTGYFAEDSATKPLLHIWSLGVEEQFYLLWPILAVALAKRPSVLIIALATVGSFIVSEWLVRTDPVFAYYMLPARAGELMLGAFVAFLAPITSRLLGWIGLCLIGASLYWIGEDSPFPGLHALPATLGAAFIIYGGLPLLSFRPMVWVGLISYSLYLWHWPIMAYLRYAYVPIDVTVGTGAFLLMLALAWLSYRFVELPFRRAVRIPSFSLFGASTAVLCAVAVASSYYDGSEAFAAAIRERGDRPAYAYEFVCQREQLTIADLENPACLNGKPNALLWGDSHAAHFVGVFREMGLDFRNAAASSCPPLHDGQLFTSIRYRDACRASLDLIFAHLDEYPTLVLGGQWSAYVDNRERFEASLRETVRTLSRNHTVILLAQVPQMKGLTRDCEERAIKLPMIDCRDQFSYRMARESASNSFLETLARETPNTHYYSINQIICPSGRCSPYLDNRLIYFDRSHLSMRGAQLLGRVAPVPPLPD